jgi:para-aminobenzoate synthetase component 1
MEIGEFTMLLNTWSKARIPFIFVIDFEMQMPQAWRIDEVDRDALVFDFNGFTNQQPIAVQNKAVGIDAVPGAFESYHRKFDLVMRHLERGDSFLTNLTLSTPVTLSHNLTDLFYLAKARYKLLIKDKLLVFSPETFVQMHNGWIRTFPMKGTIAANIPDAAEKILGDRKEMSEHVTVVDLLRNDLSMVATEVNVKRFRYVEEIHTSDGGLLQVSSEIEGRVMADYRDRLGDLLTSILPAGSICGAPKPETLKVIREAEQVDRGYYTGVCGYFDGSVFDSGVMIRYIEKRDEGFFFRSGGGITTQSEAAKEYQETLDKIYVPLH